MYLHRTETALTVRATLKDVKRYNSERESERKKTDNLSLQITWSMASSVQFIFAPNKRLSLHQQPSGIVIHFLSARRHRYSCRTNKRSWNSQIRDNARLLFHRNFRRDFVFYSPDVFRNKNVLLHSEVQW